MSDEETIMTDGVGAGETTETKETTTPEVTETPAADKPEPTLQEKIGELAAKKAEREEKEPKVVETTSGTAAATETPAYTPNFKFNVLDKAHEVPKEFQSLIKDEKSEKMVKEIFEKAYGLESVKTKATEARAERDALAAETQTIKAGIDGLRSIYQGAVQSGNFLKLDDFFAKLKIPQEHIMQYALAKVNLSNLPPEQQQLIQSKMDADKRAEMESAQAQNTLTEAQQARAQLMTLQLEYTLAKPDVKSIAEAFDAQAGKPGAFRQQVINMGNLHFLTRKVDLTPEQAAMQVIADLGLKAPVAATSAASAPVATTATPTDKKVIVRETKTIPNISGRSSSPLKKGPRSVEDLMELKKQAWAD